MGRVAGAFREVMVHLEQLGTEQNRTVFARHGAPDEQYGVSFTALRAVAKKHRSDTPLARELWETGNADAMMLACMVANPAEMTMKELESWVRDIESMRYYVLGDEFAGLVAASPHARKLVEKWVTSKQEFVGQVGWTSLAHLALNDPTIAHQEFAPFVAVIERDIHKAKNRTRHAMNGALIAIGRRDKALEKVALTAAKRIGTVHVDHGRTGCKTPDATEYIKRKAPVRSSAKASRAR